MIQCEGVETLFRRGVEILDPGYRGVVQVIAGHVTFRFGMAGDQPPERAESNASQSGRLPVALRFTAAGRRKAILAILGDAVEPVTLCEVRNTLMSQGYPNVSDRTLYKDMGAVQRDGLVDNEGCGYFLTARSVNNQPPN